MPKEIVEKIIFRELGANVPSGCCELLNIICISVVKAEAGAPVESSSRAPRLSQQTGDQLPLPTGSDTANGKYYRLMEQYLKYLHGKVKRTWGQNFGISAFFIFFLGRNSTLWASCARLLTQPGVKYFSFCVFIKQQTNYFYS